MKEVAILRRQRPACLVVDTELPTWVPPSSKMAASDCVVFVSRGRDIVDSVRAMKAGAIDYLVAPIDASALLQAVAEAIERCREAEVRCAKLAVLQQRYARLTPREREALQLIACGVLNKQAASVLGISDATLQVHRGRIVYKTIRAVHAGQRVIPAEVAMELAEYAGESTLSSREVQVLKGVARGNSNREIADQLSITEDTVKAHRKSILLKLGAKDRTHAVTVALKRGILEV